jgi:hypothetical protein
VRTDFDAKQISVSDQDIKTMMIDLMAQAVAQIQAGK